MSFRHIKNVDYRFQKEVISRTMKDFLAKESNACAMLSYYKIRLEEAEEEYPDDYQGFLTFYKQKLASAKWSVNKHEEIRKKYPEYFL